jgi:hypothetical protein
MMSFALYFVWPSKKCNVHLGQKVPFVFACFQASARKLRLEKDTLFGLDTQITIFKIPNPLHFFNCSFSSRPRKCEERNIEQIIYRVLLKVVQMF